MTFSVAILQLIPIKIYLIYKYTLLVLFNRAWNHKICIVNENHSQRIYAVLRNSSF